MPPGLQARLVRLLEAIQNVGLEQLGAPHVKHIEGKLWELRAKSWEGVARGIYVTSNRRRVVVLHVFQKKTQKMPRSSLGIARARLKQVQQ